jgi:hypothetical protein
MTASPATDNPDGLMEFVSTIGELTGPTTAAVRVLT